MQRPFVQIAVLSASILLVATTPRSGAAQAVTKLTVPGLVTGVEQRSPAAAFDGTSHLLVWEESDVVWGVVLDVGGSLVAAPFPVAAAAEPLTQQKTPAVAAAASGGGFLVVWSDDADGSGDWNIRGARVSTTGDVLDTSGLDICNTPGAQALPAVAASGSDFLVVWQDDRVGVGASDVYGTLVTGGAVLPQNGTVISEREGTQRSPAVASNGAGFLVVWEDAPSPGGVDLYGARVDPVTGTSEEFAISLESNDQLLPSVAASASGYAVAWNDQRSGGWELMAVRVDAANVVDPMVIRVAGVGAADAPHAIASDGTGYLLAYGPSSSGAMGARLGEGAAVEFPIDGAMAVPPGQALSFGGFGRYLVVHRNDVFGTPQLGAWLVTTLERLDVALAGTGTGSVASTPPGIACGGTCSMSFETGREVLLTATAEPGFVLQSWTGCEPASETTCTVTMSGPLTVTASFLDVPVAPGGPTYTNVGATSLTATWSAADGATAYALERALEDGSGGRGAYGLVVTVAETSHDDTSLASNATYWYRVRGTNAAGAGAYGSETSVTTLPGAPGTPTFSAIGADSVTVTWTVPGGGADGYELERATGGGIDWAPVATVAAPSHVDTTVAAGTEYLYRVRATNAKGQGPYSASARVTTLPLPPDVPAAPTYTDVAATSVTVGWSAITGATSYDLERAPADGIWTLVARDVAGTSHLDGALAANTTYSYRVRASNAGGGSAFSSASSVTTVPGEPGTPTFASVAATSLTVGWTAPVGGAATYSVERAPAATGTWTRLTTEHAALTFTDSGLAAGTTYWYRVLARNASGDGAPSPSASIATLPVAPDAPTFTNVAATTLTVSWSPVTGAATYALERAPAAGSAPGTWAPVTTLAATTWDDTGLAPNATYWYRVRATSASGDGAYSGESSVLTLPGTAGTPMFDAITTTSVTLSWAAPAGGAATYAVERAPAATGTWTQLTSLAALTFTDSGLTAGTAYAYRILARNDSGAGAPSASASATTLPDAPGAPTFTNVTASSLTVSWTPVTGATSYAVERAPSATGAWTQLTTVEAAPLTLTDSGLASGTTYWYRVLASNNSGPGAYSASASVVTLPVAPDAPTFTSVTASSITVSWSAVSGATGYKLERASAAGSVPGTWAEVKTLAATTWDDTGLASNATYWYRVRATNASGDGAYSAERSILTWAGAPGTPTFSAMTTTGVTVSWAAPTGGAATYSLERASAATGTWTQLTTSLDALSYTDSALAPGTTYWYRVLASNSSGAGVYSASAFVATLPVAPGEPTFTNVTASSLTMSWSAVTGATGYKVERAPDAGTVPGTWTEVKTLAATTWDDTGLASNATYWYRVRAWNASGDGAYSPQSSVLTLPGTPGTPTFAAITTASLTVRWTAPAGGAADYEVERATSGSDTWTVIATKLTALSHADGDLSAGTTYSYRVRGWNATGAGAYSVIASVPTLPGAPGAPTFSNVTASTLTVSWPAVTGATSYKVERADDVGGTVGTWTQIATNVAGTSHPDTGRASNATYWYRVRAWNASGDGAYSPSESVLTLPAIPGTPTLTAVTDRTATVTWTAPTGGADGYDLERATSALGPWTRLVSNATTLGYDDATLDPGVKYWYRVRGVNASGAGLWSASASLLTLPDASGALWFTGVSTVSLTVNWVPTAGATTYDVERALDVSGEPGAWGPTEPYPAVGLLDTYFNDAVAPNTTYWYRVRGANTSGYGDWSPASSVTTLANDPAAAPTFSNVTATSVTVSWTAPAGSAASYVVERATSALGPWAVIQSGVTALSYDDFALSPETTYWYRIRATNSTGATGAPSRIAAVTTLSARPSSAPGTPTFGSIGTTSVTVAWTAAADATSYKLERASDAGGAPGAWVQIVSQLSRTYPDGALGANSRYWYRVRGSNEGGDGPYSAMASVATLPNAPGTPTFPVVAATSVTVSWTEPAGGAASYVLERATSDRPWATVQSGVTGLTYPDTGLTANSLYYYRVRATNAAGQSGATSSVASVTTSPDASTQPSGTPGTPTYSSVTATAVTVAWSAATGAEIYALERSADANGAPAATWTQIASLTTLSYRDTSRTANTVYWYRVRASSVAGTTVSGESHVMTAPAAPGAPTFPAVSAASITVSWTAPPGGAATYKVERAPSSIGPWALLQAGLLATTFEDAVSANTTYYYRVRATNAAGLDGVYSASRSVTTPADTTAPAPGIPASPTYSGVSATYLTVSWVSVADATGYTLERAAASAGPWIPIATKTATSFTDTGRTANTPYWYRVRASNGGGDGPSSAASSVVTAPNAPGAPSFPSIGVTTVTVSWTAPTSGAASYKLERATTPIGPWTIVASGIVPLSHVDTGLTGHTTYYYRVRATNSASLDGAPSASRFVVTAEDTAVPAPGQPGTPTYSSITASYVKVSWASAANATSYALERATASTETWAQVTTTGATSFTDTGRAANTTYRYRVRASNGGGDGPYSLESSVMTAPSEPGAPAFTSIGATTVTVSWTEPTGGATSYKLERATSALGPWTATAGIPTLSHADSGLTAYTTYYYRVRATNSAGLNGGPSATRSVLTAADPTGPAPGEPGAPTYSSITATYVTVSWTPAANALSYELERAVDPAGAWTRAATTGATSVTDTGRVANTIYWYRVRGTSGGGVGPYSSATSVTTAPSTPGTPEFTAVTSTTATVAWAAPIGGAASYKLERAMTPVGPWTVVESRITAQTYEDSELAGYTTYYYRVRGTNAAGLDGIASSSAAVTTQPNEVTVLPGVPGTPVFSNVNATWLQITWTAATDATSYVLERADAADGLWTVVATTTTTTSFSDTGRTANTRYWYRVRGTNGGGAGDYSGVSSITTAPNAPGAPTFSVVEATSLTVTWTAPTRGAASYRVERATSSVGPWLEIASVATILSHADSGLAASTTYYYRVRGTNEDGINGAYSLVKAMTTGTVPGS